MKKTNAINKLRQIIKEEVRKALLEKSKDPATVRKSGIVSFDEWEPQVILDHLAEYYSYISINSDQPGAIEDCGLDPGYHFEVQADIYLDSEPFMASISGITKEGDSEDVGDIPIQDLAGTGEWEIVDYTKK